MSFTDNSLETEGVGKPPSKKATAMEAALRKLNCTARTEREIRDALAKLEYGADEIDETVEVLKSYGYIDDENFCRQYFRYSKGKGKADFRILKELEQKGIGAELAKAAFEEVRAECRSFESDGCADGLWQDEYGGENPLTDDKALALQVGEKLAAGQVAAGRPVDERFLARVGRRLAALGYDSGTAYGVIGKLKRAEELRRRRDE